MQLAIAQNCVKITKFSGSIDLHFSNTCELNKVTSRQFQGHGGGELALTLANLKTYS